MQLVFAWAKLCPQLVSREPIKLVLSVYQRNPALPFVLPVPPGKRKTTKSKKHREAQGLGGGFLGWFYSGPHGIAVQAITCRQLNLHMLSCCFSMWDGSQWRKGSAGR